MFIILLATSFNYSLLAAGEKIKGEISVSKGQLMEFQILPANKKEVKYFLNVAKSNPTASIVVVMDLDGDGHSESYVFRPDKDENCDRRNHDCDDSITVNTEVTSIAEIMVNRGLPTGKRIRMVSTQSNSSITAYNGSITIKKVSETVEQNNSNPVQYESFSILFNNPEPELRNLIRKGWDGSIKGFNLTAVDGSVKDSKITLTIMSGKNSLMTLSIQRSSEPGRMEECESSTVCKEHMDSVLNLIR